MLSRRTPQSSKLLGIINKLVSNFYVYVIYKIFIPRFFQFTLFFLYFQNCYIYKRLHKYKLQNLKRSPNIVRVNKSRRLRWAGHVARMEEGRSSFKILTG